MSKKFVLSLFLSNAWGCQDLLEQHKTDNSFLEAYKSSPSFDLDCLDSLVKHNFFNSAKFMLSQEFGGQHDENTARALSKAQSVVQGAIQFVKNQQEEIMQIFESTQQMS